VAALESDAALETQTKHDELLVDPPSAQKRKENIKRIRGGAQVENREAKKSKSGKGDGGEKIAMMKVVTQYFAMKLAREKRACGDGKQEQRQRYGRRHEFLTVIFTVARRGCIAL
jgi:hypothetical protein